MCKKALFWDFDGTLIHPNESFLCALKVALEHVQYAVEIDVIRKFLHTACTWYKPEISYEGATGAKWWETLFRNFEGFYKQNHVAEADWQTVNMIFKDSILDHRNYTLYDGAKDILRQCQGMGYENYILSNNFPELPRVIDKLGLSDCFAGYIVSSNVGFEKPRIEIFQYALKTARYPDMAYMIGDNPVADIAGGRSAGMKSILVHNNFHNEKVKDSVACDDLSDVVKVLEHES